MYTYSFLWCVVGWILWFCRNSILFNGRLLVNMKFLYVLRGYPRSGTKLSSSTLCLTRQGIENLIRGPVLSLYILRWFPL